MKKKNIKYIIIACVVIVFALVIAFFAFNNKKEDKPQDNKDNTSLTEENNISVKGLKKNDIASVYNKILDYNQYYSMFYPINDINSIDKQYMFYFATLKLGFKKEIKSNEINDIFNKYFSGYSYEDKNILCVIDSNILYSFENGSYIMQSGHAHGIAQSILKQKVYLLEGSLNDNRLVIKAHVLYGDYDEFLNGGTSSYYATFADSYNETNKLFTNVEDVSYSDYQSVRESLPTTIYTFDKKGNDYALVSVAVD